jgi:hypothetical protein
LKQFNFSVSIAPTVLLIDDDDKSNNVEGYYTEAMSTLGIAYDVWDHNNLKSPNAAMLERYPIVIWLCEWAFPALNGGDRNAISTFLDDGGKLFLSGQDIGWDLADPSGTEFLSSSGNSKIFYENYLKSYFIADDAGISTLIGVQSDSIAKGMSITRFQPGRDASNQYPDVVRPINGSTASFLYSGGSYKDSAGAVTYNGTYQLVYFSFGGFESITDSSSRLTILYNILKFFGKEPIMSIKATQTLTVPFQFTLSQNYPNPFNPSTVIDYAIPHDGHVFLSVYDMLGRKVSDVVNETKHAGTYHVSFDGSQLASGIYFYKLTSGTYTEIKKMLLLK